MKLAIVHDYLNQMGGAEKVLLVLHEMFPDAPIYTSMYAPELVDPAFRSMDVRTTFMQRLPLVHRKHQPYLPVYPFAFESIDLREYDVVLSMSSAWSKNVLTRPDTCHVNYCLTPMRFGWSIDEYAPGELSGWQRWLLGPVLSWLRTWDAVGANRVDYFVAISSVVSRRIGKYYRRDSAIIHPPVPTTTFRPEDLTPSPARDSGYFLIVSRLIPYKRVDLAIQACNQVGASLKIIGAGRDRSRLESLAGPTIEFLGWQSDAQVREHLQRCAAFVFPAEEDFGIAPVEAMAAGRPVVAFGAGGALDTVVEGVTGLFFRQPSVAALATTLDAARRIAWDPAAIVAHASQFDVNTFKSKLAGFVEAKVAEHRTTMAARPK